MKNKLVGLKKELLISIIIFILSVVIRLPYLGYESINPDAVNWHYRCQQFANGIKYLQLEKTYPHYHPGVILCEIMFLPTEIYKQFTGKIYNTETYLDFNFINSLALIVVLSFLISLISFYLGFPNGLYFAILLNLEPFFFGNSKFIHLDILVSLLLFTSFIFYKSYIEKKISTYLILSGVSLAMAFLTKSVSIVFLPGFIIGLFLLKDKFRKNVFLFLTTFLVSVFVLFPALWVAPIKTFTTIFKEADRVGVRTGHSQVFLGQEYSDTQDPGVLFYIFALIQKGSPLIIFTLFLMILNLYRLFKNRVEINNSEIVMLISYLIYLGVILISNKKLDRYLLILFPPIIYYSVKLFEKIKFKYIFSFLAIINLTSIIYFAPFQFLYFSPVLINFENSNKIIEQKSFGMGIYDLKNFILGNYGKKVIGFYDVKPMETQYSNSMVFDIRETSPNKIDIVVLSSNEKLPEKYKEFKFMEYFYVGKVPLYGIYSKN